MPTVAFIKSRRKARRYVLQALYSWDMSENPVDSIIDNYLTTHEKEKFDREYFKELLQNITKNTTDIDTKIEPFVSRPLASVDCIELALLRLATYEIYEVTDVPKEVAINEALDLAKEFGSATSYKFINGVLDKLVPDNAI